MTRTPQQQQQRQQQQRQQPRMTTATGGWCALAASLSCSIFVPKTQKQKTLKRTKAQTQAPIKMSAQQDEAVLPGTDFDHPHRVLVVSNTRVFNALVSHHQDRTCSKFDDPFLEPQQLTVRNECVEVASTWDNDAFSKIVYDMVKKAHALVVIFEASVSFEPQSESVYWCLSRAKLLPQEEGADQPEVPSILVAETSKGKQRLTVLQARKTAAEFGAPCMELNAATGDGVRAVLEEAVQLAGARRNTNPPTRQSAVLFNEAARAPA